MSRGQTARLRSWSLCGTGTRRVRVSRVGASSRQACAGPGTLRGPVCRVPASSRQTCAGPVHMGALLAGSRELGPDECHHWLDHVRNCETCTGPFVKTLIAQLVYLVLCGIRLIPHGTRLTRVCIFRHTSAGSCHGWNSYGTRRPRVCGIPCVSATRVPAGRAPRTHEGRVCAGPANSRQECTGVLDAAKRGSSNHGGFTAGAGRARRSWPRLSIQWGKAPARRPRRRRCRIICCDV